MKNRILKISFESGATLSIIALVWLAFQNSQSPYFPAPERILYRFREDWLSSGMLTDIVPSLTNLILGFAIAVIGGIVLGTAIGLNRALQYVSAPFTSFFRSLPPVALLPVAIVLLGLDMEMKVGFIAFGAIWPTMLSTIDGVQSVDAVKRDMATSYGFNRRRILLQVVLPGAMPAIFAGMRTTLQLALALMVISEMRATTSGIGFSIMDAQATFNLPRMWAAMIMLGIIGYLTNFLFVRSENKFLSWYFGERGRAVGA